MDSLSEHRLDRGRVQSSDAAERGSSLLGLLIVVLILGATAAIALWGLGNASNPTVTGIPSTLPGGGAIVAPSSTTTVAQSAGNDASAAATAACLTDYATVSAAVQDYEELNGSPPPSGTAWALAATNGGPLLQAWPLGDHHYTIVWNGTTLSVVPAKGVAAHGSSGQSSPPTGCYAA